MTDEHRIAVAGNYDGLVKAFRKRFVDIDMTYADFEEVFGFAPGHLGKMLGEVQSRKIGPHSLDGFLEYLACDLVLVENVERRAKMLSFWQKRARPNYNANRIASVGKTTINRMLPVIQSEIGKRASEARMTKLKPATRRRIARHAARARWKWQTLKNGKKRGKAKTAPRRDTLKRD